jgi:hypothetical protein
MNEESPLVARVKRGREANWQKHVANLPRLWSKLVGPDYS